MKAFLLSTFLLVLLQTWFLRAQSVTAIASGRFHSMILRADGSLWMTGENPVGQLGDGQFITNTPYGTDRLVKSLIDHAVTAAAGQHHSLVITRDGQLWGMGANARGELGIPTLTGLPAVIGVGINPPELILASDTVDVGAGDAHSLVVKRDGSLWTMGYNRYGQLGDGTTEDQHAPVRIVENGVKAVAGNYHRSFFIKTDGSLWGMGYNTFGELGNGDYGTGHYTAVPTQILDGHVLAVAAGAFHTLVLKDDGSLWGMGDNANNQLGFLTSLAHRPTLLVTNGVKAIAAGFTHSLFIREDGSLWGMGSNTSGELGDGTWTKVGQPKKLVQGGVQAVAARNGHSLFMKDDGSVWAMGNNSHGELGDGTFVDANQPHPLVVETRLGLRRDGDGLIYVTGQGIANGVYALESSASLAMPQWTERVRNAADPLGSVTFTNAATLGMEFWRSRQVP